MYGSGEPAAPRRQSLLRSYLAAHSFPRRPPAYVLAALMGSRVGCALPGAEIAMVRSAHARRTE